jgi:uncharacterized protein YdaU (DUF1376 family)
MTKLPSMPFFPADFFADTRHMSGEEQGAYLLMLMHAWLSGGKLPSDKKALLKLLRVHWRHWRCVEKAVLPFWDATQEGIITNTRLTQDQIRIESIHEQNKINGALGGRPKSLFSKDSVKAAGYVSPNRPETERLTNQNQNQNHLKDSLNGELRQERRWVPTKRIGSRLFKAGEYAPAYDGQMPEHWQILKPEDCN